MPDRTSHGKGSLTFGEPVTIRTEPGTYRGVRSQRVRFGPDLWATVHEDGRVTLGSYSLRFRLDALLSGRDGATLSLSTEPIAAADVEPAAVAEAVTPVEDDEPEDPATRYRQRFTWGPDDGLTITPPVGQEKPGGDAASMPDHMGRTVRAGDSVRQMGYWHGGRRRDVGRVGTVLRITRAGTAQVALDATRDLPAEVRNLGSSVIRRIDAGEPVEAFADDPAEEAGQ